MGSWNMRLLRLVIFSGFILVSCQSNLQFNNMSFTGHHYKARGIASWYGSKFNKKRTANGEHYNMYAMTAAHRTLPLNSYVRVKNLNNGRTVVVRINDRGPFFSRRIIDLSYIAARKLGLLPTGIAMVEIQPIKFQQRRTFKRK